MTDLLHTGVDRFRTDELPQEAKLAIQIEYLSKDLIGYQAASYGEWCPYTNLTTTLVKAQLPQSLGLRAGPLIPELRRQRYFFKGYHDDANMEIIVPNKLSAFVSS